MQFCKLIQCKFKNKINHYQVNNITNFVPKHELATEKELKELNDYIKCHKQILVVTGAGISTESGIPDYRSEGVGLYSTSPTRPILYQKFMSSEDARSRYWMRNYIGWPRFSSVQPNITHLILAKWQREGRIKDIVTQNVDRLHFKAGSERVTELHGTAYRVQCMSCGYKMSRYSFQQALACLNPIEIADVTSVRPDGDVDLDQNDADQFRVPGCEHCNGIIKPDVVMFGETVPASTVRDVYRQVELSDAILVLGSSLMVYSSYRFVLEAVETGKPVAIINIGPTRADDKATLKIKARCGDILLRMHS